jgi:recombination protein RecT
MSTQIAKIEHLEPVRGRFVELTDKNTFDREASFALQVLQRNDYLAKADPGSILRSVLNVAQIGLSLNPVLKLAYLVPRYNRASRQVECCLEPSYQGLVKLLTDTKSVVSVQANVVYEGDEWGVDLASDRKITHHTPYLLTGQSKGLPVAVYAIATLHDGSRMVEVMGKVEVEEIRERSESYKKAREGKGSSTWITDEGEMWRKTVIRRLFKYLPKSGAFEKVAEAVALDESDYPCTAAQWSLIMRLVHTAQIDGDKKDRIEQESNGYTSIEASRCIEYLQQNQPPADGFQNAAAEYRELKNQAE